MFDVSGKNNLKNGKVFTDIDNGLSDGFRLDTEGNVWTSAGPGVNVYNPAGALLGRIRTGGAVSNVAFGGPRRNRLFITCTDKVFSVFVSAIGAQRP